jgi:N-acetylmuramoyl-L-alanine amidase
MKAVLWSLAVLIAASSAAEARGQESPPINLRGTWDDNGREVLVRQDGSAVVAEFAEPPLCDPQDGSEPRPREKDFEASLRGDSLIGKVTVCNYGENWGSEIGIQEVDMRLGVSADGNTLSGMYESWKGPAEMTLVRLPCGIDDAVDRDVPAEGEERTVEIDLVVLHATGGPDCNPALSFKGGTLNGIVRHFQENDRGVSIHYIIGEDGSVVRMVPEDQVANHIFGSSTRNRSLGIELVNDGNGEDHFPSQQIFALADLLVEILKCFGLEMDAVQGHAALDTRLLECEGTAWPERSGQPRRVDPGSNFPWDQVREMVDLRMAGAEWPEGAIDE